MPSIEVTERGPRWDRNWVIVNDEGDFLSQRQFPVLSRVEVQLDTDILKFGNAESSYVSVDVNARGSKKSFKVWGNECWGEEISPDASAWFSNFLKSKCYFLSSANLFSRKSSQKRTHSSSLVYADGYPFLLVSQASLDLLNNKLEEKNFKLR